MTDHRSDGSDANEQAGIDGDAGDVTENRDAGPAEGHDGPLGDIVEEVRRRRAQGQGRRPPQPEGSEGAAGKLEGGEW